MKLLSIKLNNFRQFYGAQELEISAHPQNNVTLVHAENGVGKTTVLNSVLWCFYGITTKKFEKPEDIVNYAALAEGQTTASVEIIFEHIGGQYSAQRRFKQNGRRAETSFTTYFIEQGVYRHLDAPDTFINSVIPREMARYFFFDGEHAETFSAEENFKVVGQAIRSMLGCHLAELGMGDLQYATKYFNQQIGNLPGETELNAKEKRLLEVDDLREKTRQQLEEYKERAEQLHVQIESIIQKLRTLEGAKQIQARRDDKQSELNRVNSEIKTAEQNIVRWVGTKAFPLLARKLSAEALSFIDVESLRGRIPSPYNEEFVQGLLSSETCVCKRPLPPGTPEFRAVAELLKDASNAEVLGKIVRARARLAMLREQKTDAPKPLRQAQETLADLIEKRRRLEQEIGDLGKQFDADKLTEAAEMEAARKTLARELTSVTERIGIFSARLITYERQYKEVEDEINQLAGKTGKARRFIVRRDLATRAAELLRAVLKEHEASARAEIAERINIILGKTARRDYKFGFDEHFGLQLSFPDGRPVPRSSGENQLLSLAFIAALVQFSSSRANGANDDVLIPGTVAPLVLDSPFGQLDNKYRVDTAFFVPELASQVVLLVSSSQGDKDILQALSPHVGVEYALVSENAGPRGDKSSDVMIVNGKKLATSIFNCERTRTRVERI